MVTSRYDLPEAPADFARGLELAHGEVCELRINVVFRGVLLCLEKTNRRVHVRGAKVRRDNVGRRTTVNAPRTSKMTLNSDRIVRICAPNYLCIRCDC